MALTDTPVEQTVSQAANTQTFDPGSKGSLSTEANNVLATSGQPYTPLVGSGWTTGSDGSIQSLPSATTAQLQNEALDPNFKLNPNESFTSKPIVSGPEDTLQNNAKLDPLQYGAANTATAYLQPTQAKT